MDFYIEVSEEIYEQVKDLDSSLGMWFWNMAVMLAPYDTGNLRRSITLKRNTSKKIDIQYSSMKANYLHFLEMGYGPVKKYYHFIQGDTRLAIIEQLIIYLKTGVKPMFTRVPYVALRSSKSPMPKEKAYLRSANMGTHAITANARRKISMIREAQYRKQNGLKLTSFAGKKVETGVMKKQKIKGSTRGMSILNQKYIELRSQV